MRKRVHDVAELAHFVLQRFAEQLQRVQDDWGAAVDSVIDKAGIEKYETDTFCSTKLHGICSEVSRLS